MKRTLSLILCLLMGLGLALPALASEGEETTLPAEAASPAETGASGEDPADMEQVLTELTEKVKKTLDVDDDYTDFSSDYYGGPDPTWSLNWSDDARRLSVEARADGTVMNAYYWQDGGASDNFYGFDPALPALEAEQAQSQADSWYEKLFTGAESARQDEMHINLGQDGSYRFSGTVLINGLESPVTYVMVIGEDGLSSFYRSDSSSGFVGQIPGAEAAVDEDGAAAALAGAVELEKRYVSDGEGGAVLRYMPVGPRTVADAATGEAVDMDALYASFGDGYGKYASNAAGDAAAEEAMAADGGASLTETELSSIENYGDVMDENAIDESLRTIELLGLEGFDMGRCSYAMDSESGDVTATLRYTGTMTDEQLYGYSGENYAQAAAQGQDMTIYKSITLNAKTGSLLSVSTSYPLWEKAEMIGMVDQAGFAEQFIQIAAPELAAQAELCTLKGYEDEDVMTFAQVHEGYFYPDNYICVHVAPTAGIVDSFYYAWDEDVSFGPAEDTVDADAALAAYTDALDVTLGYVAWPVDILASDDGLYAEYMQWGYTFVEQLRLGYYYANTDEVLGVDAATGEVVRADKTSDSYEYDDLADVPEAEMIRTLGAAGVGFAGGNFLPEQPFTWRDGAILLLRAGGSYAPEDDDDRLLEQAYYQGFLAEKKWEPDAPMSRIEFLRMLLGASRYGCAAKLAGIWDAGFSDVDEADQPWAALARGLGLAEGDTLEPDGDLTRAGAAAVLYGFMERG